MHKLLKPPFIFGLIFSILSCSQQHDKKEFTLEKIELKYAKGFQLFKGNGFWEIEVSQPWTGAEKSFRYLILEKGEEKPTGDFDAEIQLPVSKIVVTSTTHIPHLDMLNSSDKLIGFPDTDLISSKKTRALVDAGKVMDLGSGPSANPEMTIDTDAEWVMISTLGDDIRYLDLLKNAGVNPVINGEYVEQHPLGRAEWIKFTGVLLGNFEKASEIFEEVENDYFEAVNLTENIPDDKRPSVLSGVMYQDIWYAPGADSWGAKILQNAGGNYIFNDQKGSGSLQLNYEFVLDRAIDSEVWIGSSDFPSIKQMGEMEPRYIAFKAFKNGNIYSYTQKKGPTGGLEYFELGYMRPDLILKDLIKILHPDLIPGYELYFYQQLDEK
ncbi:ABC transporter substrate-binding protein [Algoriphagus machipongonensis]|uniref:Iron(III) ABC transporter, periplasmic iron-binding protein n=1 Tax=Algoriphagus machipongonensis TaxID=388413 RepID=A3HWL7_9BACT|nr:ABC transporter substrate-binding protein [Algoriphagus machipongonensis]EAZ80990.1 putative iron(III) ABC transporter, periplasmic iron-binding protein [Algoriphagus machipongonensis]